MIIVFLKFTFLPSESVNWPSSRTCNSKLNTSGWAFSISSSNTTEYGFLLTFSVNCPPSSCPTYPGGAPINLDTANFSMYSDISILIKESSDSNKYFARTFANCVLPTPVGPRNINVPIGLFGSLRPTRPLWIALTIFLTALSCPITLPEIVSFILASLSFSFNDTFCKGIPVIIDTTSATSLSLTVSLWDFDSSSHFFLASSRPACNCFSTSRNLAASSYFWDLTTSFFFSLISTIFCSISVISLGTTILDIWTLDPASSKASIALSGRNLSVI